MKNIGIDEDVLICPISGKKMTDPVVDPEGNTFEKCAILEWLTHDPTSPITRSPLRPDQLVPNRILRDLLAQNGIFPVQTADSSVVPGLAPEFKVSLKALLDDDNHKRALIQVKVEDDATQAHAPSTIVCVIDVSYSMDAAAKMHGDMEGSAGLSQLDVVKHATRTVVSTLGPNDQLAVVVFADIAQVVVPLMKMTKENQDRAWEKIQKLRTCGSTNLYDGLLKAMDLLRLENAPNSNILLLTDGMPNRHPPRGELPTLIRYQESHPDFICRLSTFGFGYSLDSKLLRDIAVAGSGHYCFIPDSSFVGTVFVNATANILATALPESKLLLETTQSAKITKCISGQKYSSVPLGLSVTIPPLLYGQTYDVLVELEAGIDLDIPLDAYLHIGDRTGPFLASETVVVARRAGERALIETASARAALVQMIEDGTQAFPLGAGVVPDEVKELLASTMQAFSGMAAGTEDIKALREDLLGQVSEAFSNAEFFNRWGRHYLRSLSRAHVLQQCTNFKDPGLQIYATEKFSLIRDTSEAIFCKLPPPKPSLARDDANYRPVRSMRQYHNRNAPCFASGQVKMADGRNVPVGLVRSGDVVATDTGSAKVVCVVATKCEDGIATLVELEGGVLATPWHPVRLQNPADSSWKFPVDLGPPVIAKCDQVYSFVLEDGASSMRIGPYYGVSLGHGMTGDPVASHPYLGTKRVVEDLAGMVGWSTGFVQLGTNPAVRDPDTDLIIRFSQRLEDEACDSLGQGLSTIRIASA